MQGGSAIQHQWPCHPVYTQWGGATMNPWSVPLILEQILLQSMPMAYQSSLTQEPHTSYLLSLLTVLHSGRLVLVCMGSP